jgi:threonylcarbamoyladenosine tRNA methylthiotransferase MtaB
MEGRTRALLKVEDGCVNFCTYCIIPYARGPIRSLPLERAVEETKRLAAEGYHELVLTGIEISSWGRDLKNGSLIDLIEGVCQAAPELRVRLGSLEPRTITEEFCRRAAALPNLCPHFHLSLQSGCDATLKRMNRKYDTARYLESVELLRRSYDRPAITTDLITGFPGETEEEFSATLDFIQQCGFSSMHIFPYSRREGTPADQMPDQVPKSVKEERAHRAAEIAGQMEANYLNAWVGQTLPVLFEEEKNGLWRGHAPNYVEVWAASAEGLHNVLRDVTITAVRENGLLGTV